MCWVTPNFWENALTDEKKKNCNFYYSYFSGTQTVIMSELQHKFEPLLKIALASNFDDTQTAVVDFS